MKNNSGFTLVEIAVVLVIIGLLLGGILSGQSLIRSMQAKDVIAMVDDLRAATGYFRQRHHYLPGDFPVSVAGEIPGVNPPGGNGNGAINGTVNARGQASVGSEVEAAPFHLFQDGFIGRIDSGDSRRRIRTRYGAVHLVSAANSGVATFTAANPTVRNVIVFFNLPRELVDEVDSRIDDGNRGTGRAIGAAPNPGDIVSRYVVALE